MYKTSQTVPDQILTYLTNWNASVGNKKKRSNNSHATYSWKRRQVVLFSEQFYFQPLLLMLHYIVMKQNSLLGTIKKLPAVSGRSSLISDPSLPVEVPRGRYKLHTLPFGEGFFNPGLSGLKLKTKKQHKIYTFKQ